MCAKYCVMLHRSRAKDNKIFQMGHDGGFMVPVQSKIVQDREGKPTETNIANCSQQWGNDRGRVVHS